MHILEDLSQRLMLDYFRSENRMFWRQFAKIKINKKYNRSKNRNHAKIKP